MRTRLAGNALFFTIIISLVIGLLCSSLVFMAYYYRLQIQQDETRERLIRNANSTIELLLSGELQDSIKTADLFGEGRDSVFMLKLQWGLFELGHVKAFRKKDTVSSTFLIGTVPDSVWNSALYLLDQGRPVTFAGNTLVKGVAYLPEAGPKRGWVDGKNFEREKLVEGEIKKSENILPLLASSFLKQMLKQVDYSYKGHSPSTKALDADSIVVPFNQPTLRIHSQGKPIFLSRTKLKGNIIISSDTLIEVSSSCKLDHIILTAPKIMFKDDFKGRVQAFATDSLLTGEGCHFFYPSSLSLLEIDSIDNRPQLLLNKKCKLNGVILQYVTFLDRSLATLTVHQDAEVRGQIFADGLTSMEGVLFGTLICNKFQLSRPSGIYENHLLDCTLDRTKLSPYFLGSPLFSTRKRQILTWLN